MTANKSVNSIEKHPCGAWRSPISSDAIVQGATSIDELRVHGPDLYWIERRPAEGGRCVIVNYSNDRLRDLLPAPYSCRSRVHEYGGGSYCVSQSAVYFVNDSDQNIYRLDDHGIACILDRPALRFADLCYDAARNRIVCICEDHSVANKEPVNTLLAIGISNGNIEILSAGSDFYSSPCFNNDFTQLAWLSWDHPDMPWDSTRLWLADVAPSGMPGNKTLIAGDTNVSIFQPRWSPDGQLYYVSDESGWWNIYRHKNNRSEAVTDECYEFGLPHWVFGQSTFTFLDSNTIFTSFIDNGDHDIAYIDVNKKSLSRLEQIWSSYSSIQSNDQYCYFIAQSQSDTPQIIKLDTTSNSCHSIKASNKLMFDDRYLSHGQTITFKTRHGDDAHAIYYPPVNPEYSTVKETPPLIVITHGGPTAASNSAFDSRKQFWTSRGFAVIDVNYSGSTGFGRAYRQRLNGNWGIRDAEDCCDAAQHMVDQGLADPDRLIIKGSSAGGYTVLCALTFHDLFSAGASYYGISELESLVKDTHKFEARYLDRLVGPWPESREIYHQRSPIHHVDQLNCPVIFFQGVEDRVVPKEQAEKMFAALVNKGIATAYVPFAGEQHGFRKAETIKHCLEAELSFYATVFDIPVANKIPLDIRNIG